MCNIRAKELLQAIRQLEDTKISMVINNKNGKEHRNYRFSLVTFTGFIADGEASNPGRIKACCITLHPAIVDRMRQEHFSIFNWERLSALEPLTTALYKRLYLHFSNLYQTEYDRKGLKFEKSYDDVCAEWLGGLKPERYKSRVEQQLGPHFEELKRVGIIRSVVIERMADGDGFKLVFRPGAGFFEDYEILYLGSRARVLQFQQKSDSAVITQPIEIASYFYQKLHKSESSEDRIFSENDVEFVRELIDKMGDVGVRDLIDFAIEQAPKTNFDMKNIRAIGVYLPEWQADRERKAKRLEAQGLEAKARKDELLHQQYEEYCEAQRHAYLDQCTPEEIEEINRLARQLVGDQYPCFGDVQDFRQS